MRNLALWFAAGLLAVPLFHQTALLILGWAGLPAFAAFDTTPTAPFGVPQVVSSSFWGGLWGVVLGIASRWFGGGARYWLFCALLGATAPMVVAVLVVLPLKQIEHEGAPALLLLVGLTINAAWGVGAALLRRLFPA